jgi:hypothetical protein
MPAVAQIKAFQMVQQRISAKTSIKLEQLADDAAHERSDRELSQERVDQAKTAAIHNWLNSKICAKAC